VKIFKTDSFNNAFDLILKKDIWIEIESILNEPNLKFKKNSSRKIKTEINRKFNEKGYSDRIRILNTRLTISFIKSKVGICFQIGNVARTYADILKLSYLINNRLIDVGVIIVPMSEESKLLGTNYAKYERLFDELKLFKDVIKLPILLIGLSN